MDIQNVSIQEKNKIGESGHMSWEYEEHTIPCTCGKGK